MGPIFPSIGESMTILGCQPKYPQCTSYIPLCLVLIRFTQLPTVNSRPFAHKRVASSTVVK